MSQVKIDPAREKEIVEVVNRHGLVKAANKLGFPQSTLWKFIHRHGYVRTQQYVKVAVPNHKPNPNQSK